MAKAKAKTVAGRAGKVNVKSTPPKSKASDSFNAVEKFYIENNHTKKSVTELAADLNKSVKLIKQYLDEMRPGTRVQKLLQRPTKGVLAMTEGASMAADDRTRNIVTTSDIQKAIAEGNLEKAAKLQGELNKQREGEEARRLEQYSDRVARIWQ